MAKNDKYVLRCGSPAMPIGAPHNHRGEYWQTRGVSDLGDSPVGDWVKDINQATIFSWEDIKSVMKAPEHKWVKLQNLKNIDMKKTYNTKSVSK